MVRDVYLERTLRKEISSLSELDMAKDRFNTKIKTSGSYAVIEKNVKQYFDTYAVNFQDILKIVNDEEFKELLLVSNFSYDGPNFKRSLEYITNTKKDFNNKVDMLIEYSDLEKMENDIINKLSDPYYISLFQQMLGDDLKKDFLEHRSFLEETKDRVNLVFTVSENVFTLLKENSNDWKIEDGQIKFKTVELLNKYNSYVMQIN